MRLHILFFCLLLLSGCNKTNKQPIIIEQKTITEKKLTAEKILTNKVFSPDFLTKSNDKLVISSHLSDTVLHIYELPSLKHLNSLAIKGEGPDDFQTFPMFCESSNDYLYIWGYNPITIKKFSIGQHGELNCQEVLRLSRYDTFNNMHIFRDSLFIYYLPDLLTVIKCDLKNNIELDKFEKKRDNHQETFFYSNRGSIAANESFLVYGYLFKKQIDIYKIKNFKLHKEIIGDYKFKAPVIGNFDTPIYYKKLIACKNFFYALCYENLTQDLILEVYNYDGQLITKYSFDIAPQLFVIDESNNMMYGYNDQYEDYLLRYNL